LISAESIATLKAAMPDVLHHYGVRSLGRNFSSLWREDRDPSCKFYPDTNLVTDFGEGVTIDVFGLVGKVEGISGFADQARVVSGIVGHDLDEQADYTPKAKVERPPFEPPVKAGFSFDVLGGVGDRFFDLYEPDGRPALDYLYGRGFDDADIARCGLGYEPASITLADCFTMKEKVKVEGYVSIPFPLDAAFSRVHYCMMRAVPADQPPEHKEIRPTGVKSPLFREYLLAEGMPIVYLVEGLLDAIALEHVSKRPIAVIALGGTGLKNRVGQVLYYTPPELRPRKVVIAMDNDGAGDDAAKAIAADLKKIGVTYSFLNWPDGCKDACDVLASRGA